MMKKIVMSLIKNGFSERLTAREAGISKTSVHNVKNAEKGQKMVALGFCRKCGKELDTDLATTCSFRCHQEQYREDSRKALDKTK